MNLRVVFLTMVGLVGFGASYALADGGHGTQGANGPCQRAHVLGTVAGPQTFTVTVTRSGPGSPVGAGQPLTVTIGQPGQDVRIDVGGCTSGSALAANEAELHVAFADGHGDRGLGEHGAPQSSGTTTTGGGHDSGEHQWTTQSTTTTTTTTTTGHDAGEHQATTQSTTTTTTTAK